MTASVASFLTQAQKKGSELPPALSGALLLAAMRLSEKKQQALRPYQLLVDDDGELELLSGEPPTADGYAAPELRNGAALPHDPRVLVYAAGALGYELVTLTPPRLSGDAGAELEGPFGPVIRKAMGERRERFRTLEEMAQAIETIQARPTSSEEKLILAAVASSTQLPAAQKLAKIELQRATAGPGAGPPPQATAPETPFAPIWDKLEPEVDDEPPPPAPKAPAAKPAPDVTGVVEQLRAQLQQLEADRKKAQEDWMMLAGRIESLSGVRSRVDALEELVKSSVPPPAAPATALAQEVKLLVDERRFAEAEKALQSPLAATDATLQLRLGQTLAAMTDPDGGRATRAEAAFRRASQLDPSWAQPKAHLGLLLLRKGKREEGLALLRAALEQDPTCPEAQQALAQTQPPPAPRRGFDFRFVVSTAIGAVAAATLVIAVRPAPAAPAPPTVVAAIAAPPAPAPAPDPKPPAPQPQPDPGPKPQPQLEAQSQPPAAPEPPKPARPDPKPRKKPLASAGGNRAAAEAEAAKGDKALRAFDTKTAQTAFESALKLDPALPGAHRGMGMVYVLLGKNAEAKAEYAKYLALAPDAADKDQIERLLAR